MLKTNLLIISGINSGPRWYGVLQDQSMCVHKEHEHELSSRLRSPPLLWGWRIGVFPHHGLLLGLGFVEVEPRFVHCDYALEKLISLTVEATKKRHWHLHARCLLILREKSQYPPGAHLVHLQSVCENAINDIYANSCQIANLLHWSSPILTDDVLSALRRLPHGTGDRSLAYQKSHPGHHGTSYAMRKLSFLNICMLISSLYKFRRIRRRHVCVRTKFEDSSLFKF